MQSKVSRGTGVTGLMRGLATLPKVHPGTCNGRRQGWKTPRGPAGSALLLCCSGSALLTVERSWGK